MTATSPRADVYSRVTSRIVAELEQGVRPWLKPWNAEHAAGRITRRLRANGQPYKGYQRPDAMGQGFGAGFRQSVLDDLQTGAGTWRASS
jgi:antirestriction protein ArdC